MPANDRRVSIFPEDAILTWMTDNLTIGTRKPTDQWERAAYGLKYLVELYGEKEASLIISQEIEKTWQEWEKKEEPWIGRGIRALQRLRNEKKRTSR